MSADAKRWTYKVIPFRPSTFFRLRPDPEEIAKQLNRLGEEGWELVSVVEGFGVPAPVFYLKRPA